MSEETSVAVENAPAQNDSIRWLLGALGLLLFPLVVESSLVTPEVAAAWFSTPTWFSVVQSVFGAEVMTNADQAGVVQSVAVFDLLKLSFISWLGLAIPVLAGFGVCRLLSNSLCASDYLKPWAYGLMLLACWWLLKLIVSLTDWEFGNDTLLATLPFWWAVAMALPLAFVLQALLIRMQGRWSAWKVMIGFGAIYTLVFVCMNYGLWFNLRIPHGDSSMYEEHLWNVMHGKGFRSYLDQGLFLGEHIQFIHLALLPVYALWPSHLLLELAESLVIAWCGFLVYRLCCILGASKSASVALGVAMLLAFPMQYLDIAVDLKTFRPIVFGLPFCLLGLMAWEQKRPLWTALWFAIMLTAKEDYAIIIGCFGASVALKWLWYRWRPLPAGETHANFQWQWGLGFFVGGIVALKLALEAIVWFRSGVEVHYASYFQAFGETTSEIVFTMLTQPWLVIAEVVTVSSIGYACCLLIPLGGLALRSPWRLLSCLPMFVLLCLNELSRAPQHHFHAPVMPLLLWASAEGLAKLCPAQASSDSNSNEPAVASPQPFPRYAAFVVAIAMTTSLPYSLTPMGLTFWDAGSQWYGPGLYFPDERAKAFAGIPDLIPQQAHVASTDFIHPRFTHYHRSYDYSQYARTVSGGTTEVPEQTEYIVIDTGHPYSDIQRLDQVREYQQTPEQWDVVPNDSEGYFLILKRRQ